MRRPEREEAAPERQDALPLREDAQTGALLESLARGAGGPLWICSAFPLTVTTQRFCLKGALTGQGAAARELLPCGSVPEETMREALREGKWCQGAAGMAAPLALPKRATPGQKAAALSCWMRRWIVLCTAE